MRSWNGKRTFASSTAGGPGISIRARHHRSPPPSPAARGAAPRAWARCWAGARPGGGRPGRRRPPPAGASRSAGMRSRPGRAARSAWGETPRSCAACVVVTSSSGPATECTATARPSASSSRIRASARATDAGTSASRCTVPDFAASTASATGPRLSRAALTAARVGSITSIGSLRDIFLLPVVSPGKTAQTQGTQNRSHTCLPPGAGPSIDPFHLRRRWVTRRDSSSPHNSGPGTPVAATVDCPPRLAIAPAFPDVPAARQPSSNESGRCRSTK